MNLPEVAQVMKSHAWALSAKLPGRQVLLFAPICFPHTPSLGS